MTDKPDLAALLGSRICHDLISPIGAIGNGVELLSLQGGGGPELALISESVAHASARIRFFRIAYGGFGPDQRIARTEITSILTDLWRGTRMSVDWTSPGDLSRRDVKLVFLLLQCIESMLPLGGRLRVEEGQGRWTLTAEAQRVKADLAVWETLVDPAAPAEIGAAEVQFALAAEELRRQHRRLVTEVGASRVQLAF